MNSISMPAHCTARLNNYSSRDTAVPASSPHQLHFPALLFHTQDSAQSKSLWSELLSLVFSKAVGRPIDLAGKVYGGGWESDRSEVWVLRG